MREAKQLKTLLEEYIIHPERPPFSDSIDTGISSLDQLTGGFFPGEFVVIGGRPGMGKTQLAVYLALHISEKKKMVYYSFELPESVMAYRFTSTITGADIRNVVPAFGYSYPIENEPEKTYVNSIKKIENKQLFIISGMFSSFEEFTDNLQEQIKGGCQVIVIDYLQLLPFGPEAGMEDVRSREIDYMTGCLRNMARKHNVCMIIVSQLNRTSEYRNGPEGKRPRLSDFHFCGILEELADKVLFIYRPAYYRIFESEQGKDQSHLVELEVAKNRSGKSGSVFLTVDDNFNFREKE